MINKNKQVYDKKIHNTYYMRQPLAKYPFNFYRSPKHHIINTFIPLYRFGCIQYEVHLLD